MKTSEFSQNVKKLTKQRNVAYLLIATLSVSLLFSSGVNFFKKERIVVVPTMGESYELASSSAVYLERMGVFISNLFLNRSPIDAVWRNRNILKHSDPSFYHELKEKLDGEFKFLSSNKEQTFIFYPEKSDADPSTMSFVTEGKRVVFIGTDGEKSHISQSDTKRYRFGFRKKGDQLLLISIKKEDI